MNKEILEIIIKNLEAKEQMAFDDLWEVIKGEEKFGELNFNDKSRAYLEISTNKLFINLGNNVFSLRANHKHSEVMLATNKIYVEDKK